MLQTVKSRKLVYSPGQTIHQLSGLKKVFQLLDFSFHICIRLGVGYMISRLLPTLKFLLYWLKTRMTSGKIVRIVPALSFPPVHSNCFLFPPSLFLYFQLKYQSNSGPFPLKHPLLIIYIKKKQNKKPLSEHFPSFTNNFLF